MASRAVAPVRSIGLSRPRCAASPAALWRCFAWVRAHVYKFFALFVCVCVCVIYIFFASAAAQPGHDLNSVEKLRQR